MRMKLEALEVIMDCFDTLRDIRDMYRHWYFYARRNRPDDHTLRLEYLTGWDVLTELVIALR